MSARNYPLAERPKHWADWPATYLLNFLSETGFPSLTTEDRDELRRLVDGFLYGRQEADQ